MVAANGLTKIMESMGWTDGTFIPIANEENKLLMQDMQALMVLKEERDFKHQELSQREKNLVDHSKNAKVDIAQNLQLLEAHRSQLSDEHHLYKVAEYEDGTLIKRMRELRNNVNELEKYEQKAKDDVLKSHENVNKMSDKIKWTKVALDEWRQAMARGDEANKMIAKYCKEDEVKANRLENKRRSIQTAINKQRQALIDANEDQRSLESVLDRTAQLYRQAHQERQNLVNTWKEAVLSMRSRDREIEKNSQDLETGRELTRRLQLELKQQEEFLERQIQNNREVEQQISDLNDETTTTRRQLTDQTDDVMLKRNDLVTLKKLSQNLANRLQQQRRRNREVLKEQTAKEQALEHMREVVIVELQDRLGRFRGKKISAEDRLRSMDEIVDAENKQLDQMTAETTRLSGQLFRVNKLQIELRDQCKVLEMEIISIESDIKSERTRFTTLEADLIRQTDVVYNVDFKTTDYESRVAKMMGANTLVDPMLFAKLTEVEKANEEKKAKQVLVKKQVQKIEDDMRQLTATLGGASGELENLQSRLQDKRLELEGGVKELDVNTLAHQESLVELSVLKMRVNQMNDLLEKQRDKVFNLQRHQADLELAMNERLVEINSRKEELQYQRKHTQEELTQMRADIGERNLKIRAIQARYENALELLGRNEDGSFVSATQIKIETAQEKQILLRDGNALNERVIQAEKDLEAIENTLVLLNYSNVAYKRSMEPPKEDNKECSELNDMQIMYAEIQTKIKQNRSKLKAIKEAVVTLQIKQKECVKEFEFVSRIRLENNDQLMKMHHEIQEQKAKMERAHRDMRLARKTAKQKLADPFYFVHFETDMKGKEVEARNQSALQQLADLVDANDSMGPIVSKQLFEMGITIPAPRNNRSSTSSKRPSVENSASIWSNHLSKESYGFVIDSETSLSMSLSLNKPSVVTIGFCNDQCASGNTATVPPSEMASSRSSVKTSSSSDSKNSRRSK